MKKSLVAAFFLCCFALCVTVANVSAANDVKIATISIQQILSTSSAALAAQKNIQEEVKKFQEKFKPMEDELSAMESEIKKKSSVWSAEVLGEKEREYQKELSEYQLKAEHAKSDIQKMEKDLMEPVLKELHKVIEELGKKNGYTLILENTMKGLRNRTGLLYAAESLDISDMVQKELDARLKK